MNAITLADLDRTAENRDCNYGTIWDACCGPVYRVVDEEGDNAGNARIRHLYGRYWLYVDDTDGYIVMSDKSANYLQLVPEDESD